MIAMSETFDREVYFDWLCGKVYDSRYDWEYEPVLRYLDDITWYNTLNRDANRQSDGHDLRYRFGYEYCIPYSDIDQILNGPVTVLEVLIALAIRGEETIMSDSELGDRTSIWFWEMVNCMHLLDDGIFDFSIINTKVDIMLSRQFEPNGDGGLFKVDYPKHDMRYVEFWYQMNWYFNTLN